MRQKNRIVSAFPAFVDVTQFRLTLSAIGSRSAFYAIPVYLLGSVWAAAAAQAALVSGVLDVFVRAVGWRHRMAFIGLVVVLTLTTALPFFAAFIMPDIFTGLSIIAAGLLLFFFDRLSTFARWALAAVIAYAMGAHNSNALLGALLCGTVAGGHGYPRTPCAGSGAGLVDECLLAVGHVQAEAGHE